MATSEADVAAKLIERLLVDPAFRARFRRNPAEACREAGLDDLAQEMSIGAGKAMMTLDLRESKSSLAGVMMAAAMEGVGVMQFVEHVAPHLDDIPEAIGDVLSRVNLPAVGSLGGALAHGPKPSAPALPDAGGGGGANGVGGADAGIDTAAAGNGAAPAAAAAPATAPPVDPAAAGGGKGAAAAATPEQAAAAKPQTAAEAAAAKIAQQESPAAKTAEQADKAVADITEQAKDLPSATDLPDGKATPQASVDVGADPKAVAPADPAAAPAVAPADPAAVPAAATPEAAAAAPPAVAPPVDPAAAPAAPATPPVEPSGRSAGAADVADAPGGAKRHPIDPTEFGQSGHGGTLSPEAAQLLKNKNVELGPTGVADLKAGRVDPRVIAVVTKLSGEHKLKISGLCSDAPKFAADGSVSTHSLGRGLDIASVDGEPVDPGSAAARELASELSRLPEKYRPDEIGSPWPIRGSGYFTDSAHHDHISVGFKTDIPKDWAPPKDVSAGGADAAAAPDPPAAASAAPATPAAPVPPPDPAPAPPAAAAAAPAAPAAAAAAVEPPKPGQSGQFMAAQAHAAEAGAAARGSGQFLAVHPPVGPASAVADPASVPAAVDAATAAAAGSGGSSLGVSALQVAQSQLGVHETGVNTGAQVDKYLAEAKVGPGNPWCASFVTWSLAQSGHKMPGSGWAAVSTWVQNAEKHQNNLQVVSAEDARPGDIVAYDWGGQEDFGSDGHIGFLASNVKGGKFTALEGNNHDAVSRVPRQVSDANVKFIRISGDGTPPATPPVAPAAPAAPVVPDAAAGNGAPSAGAADVAAAAATGLGGVGDQYPGDDAPKEQLAAWLGKQAEKRGLPKELPVMASLVESGVKNIHYGDADSVGFFQMRVGTWNQGAYAGFPDKPELQAKWFLDQAEAVKKQRMARGQSVTDPNQYGDWIADIERPAEQYRGRYGMRLHEAQGLLAKAGASAPAAGAAPDAVAATAPGAAPAPAAAAAAAVEPPKPGQSGQFMAAQAQAAQAGAAGSASGQFMAVHPPVGPASAVADPASVPGAIDAAAAAAPGSGSSTLGASALQVAQTQLGVHETGVNTGAQVDKYLAEAKVGPGNPWCASFVTWSLAQSGHKMPGSGWAAVSTWVQNAEKHQNNLQVVSADQARPGDIVAYDWGHGEDFGNDGHIGFLASNVKGGKFTALEGNNHDAVMKVPRDVSDANVKFIRIGGDAPPAAPAAAGVADTAPAGGAGVADAAAGAADLSGVSGSYPGDHASKAQLAAWLGKEAEKRGLPKQLPVMASLVESGVKNLNYGDADSVGFFQMRVGTWNQGAYKGFPEKPELQIKWFLDQAEAVKKQRMARGQSVTDPHQFGDWIADIERPAEQYRGRYGMRLGEANGLLAKAADSAPAGGAGAVADQAAAAPAPVAPAAAADVAASAAGGGGGGAGPQALAALKEAEKYKGTAYKWGGSTPQTGFDCSGLAQWAYAKAGIQIPRVTDAQFTAGNGTPVDRSHLKPGDLIFFGKPGNIYHVAISMGGDKFLHAPKTGDVVKVASLNESYFSQNFAGGRRFDHHAAVAEAAATPGAPAADAVPAADAAAVPAPAAAIDPKAVAEAQAAVARDAAEVNRANSGLFMAVKAQEERRHQTVQFMQAIDPKAASPQAAAAASAPATAPADPAAAAPATAPADPAAADAASPSSAADVGTPIQLPGDISDDYPGNTAAKGEIAKWLAKQADKHGLPPELPVMASLVESGVKNINYGDADSVGFFQMRVGTWNSGDYHGFPDHPELQAKWFIDQALAVKKQRIAAGDANFGKDPSKWGEWIADIERPAEQYRGRYQLRLREARGLLGS
jgi:cell wall-associated NlpC family hydrolase